MPNFLKYTNTVEPKPKTSISFQRFLKDNKSKMVTNYPFLSHSLIISRLKLQWKKCEFEPGKKRQRSKKYVNVPKREKSKLLFNNCCEMEKKNLNMMTETNSIYRTDMQKFDLHNKNELQISLFDNPSPSKAIPVLSALTSKNNFRTSSSQVKPISLNLNRKSPAMIFSLNKEDNSSKNIKTYSNHASHVRHRVPEVYMEKFSKVGILKSPSKLKKPNNSKVGFLPNETPVKTYSNELVNYDYDLKSSDIESEESNSTVITTGRQNKVGNGVKSVKKLKSSLEIENAGGTNLNNTKKVDMYLNFRNINVIGINKSLSNVQRKGLKCLKSLSTSVAADRPSSAKTRFKKSTTQKADNFTNKEKEVFSQINTLKGNKCNKNTSRKYSVSEKKRQDIKNVMPLAEDLETYNMKAWGYICDDIPQKKINKTLPFDRSALFSKTISEKKENVQSAKHELIQQQIIELKNDSNNEYSDQYEYCEDDAVLLFREYNHTSENQNELDVDDRNVSQIFDEDSIDIKDVYPSDHTQFESLKNSVSSQDLHSDNSNSISSSEKYRDKNKSFLSSTGEDETERLAPNFQTRCRAKKVIKTPEVNKTEKTCKDSTIKNIAFKPTKMNSIDGSFSNKGKADETVVHHAHILKVPHNMTDIMYPVSAVEKQKPNYNPTTKQSNVRKIMFRKKDTEQNYASKSISDLESSEENSEDFSSKMVSETTEILLQAIKKMQTIESSALNFSPQREENKLTYQESSTSSKGQDEPESEANNTDELTCSSEGKIVPVIGKMFDDIRVTSKVDTQAKRRLLLSGDLKSKSNFQDLFEEKDVFF